MTAPTPLLEVLVEAARAVAARKKREQAERRGKMRVVKADNDRAEVA